MAAGDSSWVPKPFYSMVLNEFGSDLSEFYNSFINFRPGHFLQEYQMHELMTFGVGDCTSEALLNQGFPFKQKGLRLSEKAHSQCPAKTRGCCDNLQLRSPVSI